MEIAVAGTSEFTLGFRLTGIKKVVDVKGDSDIIRLRNDASVGVVIMDTQSNDMLAENVREDIINSINPVFVIVSAQPQQELRKMIIRAIGVDLLREDN